jgi:hypothetical protein
MGARFLAEAALNLPLIHDVMAQCCCWPRTQPSTSNLQHCIRRGRLVYTTHVFVRYCGYALVKERVSRDLGKSGARNSPPSSSPQGSSWELRPIRPEESKVTFPLSASEVACILH